MNAKAENPIDFAPPKSPHKSELIVGYWMTRDDNGDLRTGHYVADQNEHNGMRRVEH